jgi:hypothetical protein
MGFVVVVAATLLGNVSMDSLASFAIPLAAIVFILSGMLVPSLPRLSLPASKWPAPDLLIIAASVGIGMVTHAILRVASYRCRNRQKQKT